MKQLPLGVRLSDRARFDSFVSGPNDAALAAVHALLAPDGHGVLVLWGPLGSGRSHLLQAAAASLPDSAYLPLAQLRALGPDVLEGTARAAYVGIDDLQVVVGDPAWEERLFFVWREVEARRGRLAVACDRAPAALPLQLRDLASRLSAAPAARLQLLDDGAQREVLRLRATLRGLEMPDETATWLLRRYPRDLPSLLALLDALDVAALAAQRRLTVPFIREALAQVPP